MCVAGSHSVGEIWTQSPPTGHVEGEDTIPQSKHAPQNDHESGLLILYAGININTYQTDMWISKSDKVIRDNCIYREYCVRSQQWNYEYYELGIYRIHAEIADNLPQFSEKDPV